MQRKQCSGVMCRKHTCNIRHHINHNTIMQIFMPLGSRETADVKNHTSLPSLPTPSRPHHHRFDCCVEIEPVCPSNRGLLFNYCVRRSQWPRHTRLGEYLQFNGPTTCLSSAQLLIIMLSGVGASLRVDGEHQVFLLFRFIMYTRISP